MTKNSFSKSAIRARMKETGEPYSVAARALADSAAEEPTATLVYPPSAVKGVADYGALIVFCERITIFSNMGHTIEYAMKLTAPHTSDPVLTEAVQFVLSERSRELAEGESRIELEELMELRPNAFRGVFPEVIRTIGSGSSDGLKSMANLYRTELEMEERAAQLR